MQLLSSMHTSPYSYWKIPQYHVVLDSLGPKISWTCWWREITYLNQKLNLNCLPYIQFLGAFALRRAAIRFVMSVCTNVYSSTLNILAPTAQIFIKFHIWIFFENLSRKFKFHYNRTRITATSCEDQYICLTISCSFPLRIENVSDKSCRENQNTRFTFKNVLFFFF